MSSQNEVLSGLKSANPAEVKAAVREVVAESESLIGAPISERDRRVYEALCVRCKPMEVVMERFGLSETNLRNIACQTQRRLAREAFELRELSTLEELMLFYQRLHWQLGMLHEAFDLSVQAVQESLRKKLVPPSEDQEPQFEDPNARKPRADLRCMSLANRILERMMDVATIIRRMQEREERVAAKAAPATPKEVEAQAKMDDLVQIMDALPKDGTTKVVSQTNDGPWQVEIRPVKQKKESTHQKTADKLEKERQWAEKAAAREAEKAALLERIMAQNVSDPRKLAPAK